MSDFIVLRPCLEVLLLYIRHQHEILRCLTKGGCAGLLFVKRDKKVEEIRLSLCAILLLKKQLNSIWRWSVMISGAVVLLLACISIYTAYVEGFATVQTFLGLLYCILSALDLLDVAGLSQEMVNEMRSIRQALESTPANFESGAYMAEVIVFCVVGVKIGINLISVVFKTRLLSHFFDESARYETSVNFVPPECIRQPAGRYVLRVLQFLVFVGNVCISTYLAYDQIDYYVRHVIVRVVVKTACVAGDVIFYVYQMSDFIVLRPFLEVLLLYIRQQHNALRGLMVEGSGSSLFVKRDRKVEEIRLNLCAISLLKNQMNNIWRWSLMISGAVVLLLACVSIYTAFVEGFSTLQPLLGMLYCALSVLDLLDIAVLSQEMVNEMRSMRQGLQNAPMCSENEAYFAQISYLRDTIKPNEMALSGAGFFHLNLPLIVSLAGSVITYTVILVQTSESVSTATTVK
ncbi:hypothetical protein MRX96_021665 [Rhipicephalus microplus]